MGPWPERHEERQRGRMGERHRKGWGWLRKSREWESRSYIYKAKWERGKNSWGKQENERHDDRKKTITTKDEGVDERWQKSPAQESKGINKREKETDWGVKVEEENGASIHSFFNSALAKQQALRSPFWHTFLSSQYVLQKQNCGGYKEWLWSVFFKT